MTKILLSVCLCSVLILAISTDDQYHTHDDIDGLVDSKTKSNMTYREIMLQFADGYCAIQEGLIYQDKTIIKTGALMIQDHPAPKSKPWNIMKPSDQEGFKQSLLYYDEQIHKAMYKIEQSLKTDDWLEINQNIHELSKSCVSCHMTWQNKPIK